MLWVNSVYKQIGKSKGQSTQTDPGRKDQAENPSAVVHSLRWGPSGLSSHL